MDMSDVLIKLGIQAENLGTSTGQNFFSNGDLITSYSPVDGEEIAKVQTTTKEDYEKVVTTALEAYKTWRLMPAPKRGEIVRQFGNRLRDYKQELGMLVSYEMGKSLQEGLGEVQEMIDICVFAVGLSRQLYGLTMHSERPGHRMYEQWHPLGVVGIISAFNFPVAVWAWNSALAWICGDVCIWKGSEKAPLCAIACQNIWNEIAAENHLPEGISAIVSGDVKVGEMMTVDNRIPLISATGSTRMGRIVGAKVAERFGKSLLELGLNEDFDKNRFEQEVVYYIEKFDISEEKVRLNTHLGYFIDILAEGNGKKLNFMAQEIGREINTIGSKANDSQIQHLVVNMKDELEKIKEQTANVL
jgi:aldehyde dehydrogenase (NAD+)